MADETVTEDTPKKPPTATETLKSRIEEGIKELKTSSVIPDKIVDAFVNETIEERAKTLIAGFKLRDKLEKELANIDKPDLIQKASAKDNAPLKFYTEKKAQEVAAAEKKLNNITQELNNALNNAQFDKLTKLVASGGKEEAKAGEA